MLSENASFFVRGDDGEEYGPVDLEELRQWVGENRAGLGTEVRRDEPDALWQPWQYYPELVALLAEIHATGATASQAIAPLGRRVAAFALDLLLIFFLYVPIFITVTVVFMPDFFVRYIVAAHQPQLIVPDFPLNQQIILSMIFNLVLALYVTGFHVAHGQTPAKALLRLRVVNQLGNNPSPLQAFARAVTLIFSMNLFFIPFAYAFFDPQRRTLHDFVAGTYVVET
jgi:uncharacterized RDD family membrane protein YckC